MSGRILVEGEVDESQVVEDLPLKGSEVRGPLETADGLQRSRGENGGRRGGGETITSATELST